MRRPRHHTSSWQVYADQLLGILGIYMMIATVMIVMPHTKAKPEDGVHPKAEYLVTLAWDDQRDVDLDLWLFHNDCVIMFRSRECVQMSIDRDSLGFKSNSQRINGKLVVSPNQEVIAIRAVVPGDYLVAVNYFGGADAATGESYRPLKPDPQSAIDGTVTVMKVNPKVTTVASTKLHFDRMKQSLNAIAFHINEDGSVDIKDLPPEDAIGEHVRIVNGPAGHNGAL